MAPEAGFFFLVAGAVANTVLLPLLDREFVRDAGRGFLVLALLI
jgi:hypothetical protein